MKSSKEIRHDFISFFESKGHTFVRSSPVVPLDDPTILFANAGMNQFKPIFLGQVKAPQTRAVNSQKCIRVSGKHNDLEEVGVDHYHHTFFEMLGNWSFGDYYKAEAIAWAWELLTEVWGLEKERLWVTVYEEDDEAAKLWTEVTDLPADRVLRFGAKENFWEMGVTGPCGPCSEIHYYIGPDLAKMTAAGVNVEPDYRELWNLVFIQHNRLEDGSLEDLPSKHVDTGAGLERIVGVLQGQTSNYGTDLFAPIIDQVVKLTGHPYSEDDSGTPHRVIADHVRMLSFALADGAMPGNEGRGYVVRRILRRAARFGRMLDQHDPFIYELVDTVVAVMGEAYPELSDRQEHIRKVIQAEEAAFGETLDRGLELFGRITGKMKAGDTIPGEEAFKLYDTFGFPLDLTELMARERDLAVDTAAFDAAMERQRERARADGGMAKEQDDGPWQTVAEGSGSTFLGYETTSAEGSIRKYRTHADGGVEVILDRTPFYAESGGQVGDMGTLKADDFELEVFDTQRQLVEGSDEIIHQCRPVTGSIEGQTTLQVDVDPKRRQAIRLNHTATHLVHKALKLVLGDHVQQAGSLVAPDRLRFDLTHYEKITPEQITEIEAMVNDIIRDNRPVEVEVMAFEAAKLSGAVAMFGEKYGDEVRVIDVPGFSRELCGGTHVDRTGDIGFLKITSEASLAAGVRRIEAVTGQAAVSFVQEQVNLLGMLSTAMNAPANQLMAKADQQRERIKALEQQVRTAAARSSKDIAAELLSQAVEVDGVELLAAQVEVGEMNAFKDLAVTLKRQLKSAVVVLGTVLQEKPNLVVAVTDDLKEIVPAGDFIKEVARVLNGGGGGSPILATAGGKDVNLLTKALNGTAALLKDKLNSTENN